jgi:hypothetical protein
MSLAYDDAELLLSSILPDARISPIPSASLAGQRGGVDIGIAVPRDAFDEALGVLREAGYVLRTNDAGDERPALLSAPDGDVALTLHLMESDARRESPLQTA